MGLEVMCVHKQTHKHRESERESGREQERNSFPFLYEKLFIINGTQKIQHLCIDTLKLTNKQTNKDAFTHTAGSHTTINWVRLQITIL